MFIAQRFCRALHLPAFFLCKLSVRQVWAAMPFFGGVPMRSLGGRRFASYALRAAPLYRLMLPTSPTMLLLPVEKTSIARLLLFCG
ncbi:MAG: hypothetical protein HP049_00565 [Clostridiales bacterium]|nr:hypothetical protein [Clostridiales bacterium]